MAVWEFWARLQASPFFPPPSAILAKMHQLWFSGPATHLFLTPDATGNILPSLGRILAGLAIAIVTGGALGIALGRSAAVAGYLDPLLQFGRALPAVTLVPVFIALLRIGTQMEVATIAFGTVWPILLNTADGARHLDPVQVETARAFRLPGWQRLTTLIIPAALPKFFAGLRLSIALALILMVFAELAGSSSGLGYEMNNAESSFNMTWLWATLVLIAILGNLLNALELAVQHRVLAWHRRPAAARELTRHARDHRPDPLLRAAGPRAPGPGPGLPPGGRRRAGQHRRPVRLRQVHPAALRRRACSRPTAGQVRLRRRPGGPGAGRAGRGVPGLQPVPAALAQRPGQRRAAAAPHRAQPPRRGGPRPARRWPRSGCRTPRTATRGSCPAGCSSGWPSPGRWPATRGCCSWTSRSARWTRRPAEDLEDLVLAVRRQRDMTILLVTHDIDESVYVADRVAGAHPEPGPDPGRPAGRPARPSAIRSAPGSWPAFVPLRATMGRLVRS